MADFVMPSLGADMDAGTLVAFKVDVGARVERGQILAEIETDKGIIAVESFHAGIVERLLVEPGSRVPVGTRLAIIGEADASSVPVAAPEHRENPKPVPDGIAAPTPAAGSERLEPVALGSLSDPVLMTISARALARDRELDPHGLHGTGRHGVVTRSDVLHATERAPRRRVTPYALRRAAELGVPLASVVGTGAGGAVVADDVERVAAMGATPTSAVAPASAASPEPKLSPEQRMRRAIAAAMVRSKREIPHYYVSHTIDLGPALARLATHNQQVTVAERVLPAVLLLKATVVAVRKVPELNAHFVDGEARISEGVNLGVAIALRKGGLVAPAIARADACSLVDLMRALDDLVLRSRSGGLTANELGSATLTVTSLGDRGVESVFPIIHAPQVAMVGFGKIVTRPWVVGEAVLARPVVTATLAADHRVSDGHRGGLFLAAIEAALASPEALFRTPTGESP